MLPIIFVMPIIQLLILANAATFELTGIKVGIIDEDQSLSSRQFVDRIVGSGYFETISRTADPEAADRDLERGRTDAVIRIPNSFERDLFRDGAAPVQFIIDAEDGAAAGVIQAYLIEIVTAFNNQSLSRRTRESSRRIHSPLIPAQASPPATPGLPTSVGMPGLERRPPPHITIETANWFNSELDYDTFMVPGILVILVTIVGLFLSAMNVVREKEIGTIEQLNVTPIRKRELIVGKLAPFWILALVELAFGLVVAKLVFGTPTEGSLILVFLAAAVYLLVVLGIGLLVSTVTHTQQQAMFVAWFIVVIFILMSGLFTPIESMPVWAQKLTLVNPVAHFIEVMRRVMLKGAGFTAIWQLFSILAAYAVIVLTLAGRTYSKVTA